MRKVIVCNIMSLDGYVAGPGNDVMAMTMDSAFNSYNLERFQAADTLLLGRTSYDGFASYWPSIADAPEDPDNPALDETNRAISRRYAEVDIVVATDSAPLPADHPWAGRTTALGRDDAVAWVADARQEEGGDILLFASHVLWNALLAQGLVDELHLMVGPKAVGGGTPAFTGPAMLNLLEVRGLEGSENVLLRYAPL